MKLGILTSHPIQYQAPWFRALAKEVELTVFFAHRQSAREQAKAGFGVAFDWDVDLLSGYHHRFLNNLSRSPSVDDFAGCDTPEIAEIIGSNTDPGLPLTRPRTTPSPSYGERAGRGAFDAFIVCGWYLKSYLQAVDACRRARVPVSVRGDSQLGTPRSRLKRLAMEVRQRWLLRKFDGFLSVGKRHREYLEHFGVPAGKIFFAPHFVDNEWFAAKATGIGGQRSEIRSQWGAGLGDFVALFVGKLQAIKRPADLLQALGLISSAGRSDLLAGQDAQQRVPTMLAVFVGSGELEQNLRAEAEQLGVAAKFVGFKNQTELPAFYAAADVLVLPSESETWGLVVNEAMACGLPAVVSDAVGCAPDLIEEGRTGFTFPVGDVKAFGEKLQQVAAMRNHGEDFRSALAEKMRAYSVEAAVRGTIQAAEKLKTEAEK